MANPIKAVKAIGRAVGGIAGKGSKQVNPVYRQSYRQKEVRIIGKGEKTEMLRAKQGLRQARDEGYLKKPADTAKGNKRGLKAANKPTNRTGSNQDRKDREFYQGKSNLIKNADPMRPNRVRGGSLLAIKTYGGRGLVDAKSTIKQAARQKEITEDLNKKRRSK